MAAIIGALRAVLSLDSAAFEAGLTNAQRGLKSFDKNMKAIGGGIAAAGAAISVVGAGVALAVRGELDRADAIGKTASNIGVGVVQLQRLQYAAGLADVSNEDLSKGLIKLSKNMQAAVSGGGATADLFRRVGVAVTDAAGNMRSSDAVMTDLADVFAAMPPGVERTTLAMDLFGKGNAQMIELLKGGSQGLRELGDEAAGLGIIISGSTAAAAAEFNDTLTRIGQSFTGLKAQLTASLLPTLQSVATAVLGFVQGFQRMSPGVKAFVANMLGLTVVVGPVLVALGAVIASLGVVASAGLAAVSAISAGFVAIGPAILGVVTAVAGLTGGMTALSVAIAATGLGALVVGAGLAAVALVKLSIQVGGVGNALTLLKGVAVEVFDRIGVAFGIVPAAIAAGAAQMNADFTLQIAHMLASFAEFTQQVAEGMNGLFNTSLTGLSQELPAGIARAALQIQNEADRLAGSVSAKSAAVLAPLQSMETLREVIAKLGKESVVAVEGVTVATDALGVEMDDATGRAGGMGRAVQDAAAVASDSFAGLGTTVRDVFKDILKGTKSVSDALSAVADKLLDMAVDGLFDGLFGGGKGTFLGKLFGFAKGGVFDGGRVQAFARGGVVSGATPFAMSGGLGVMGEAGPEAIMPLARGRGGQLGVVAQGGGGLTIGTIDARGAQEGVAVQIVRAIQQAAPSIIEQSVAASRAAGARGY